MRDWPAAQRETYLRHATCEIESLNFASSYGEPGYDDPRSGILFANWNYFSKKAVDILERAGYAIEWSDEWAQDYETSKAYRTSPDSYSWQPYYWQMDDGEIVGGDLIESEERWRDEYIEHLTNNPRTANTFAIDFASLGWERYNDEFETGHHPGQTDDPRVVFAALKDQYDIIFDMAGGQSQFDIAWRVWIKEKANP